MRDMINNFGHKWKKANKNPLIYMAEELFREKYIFPPTGRNVNIASTNNLKVFFNIKNL